MRLDPEVGMIGAKPRRFTMPWSFLLLRMSKALVLALGIGAAPLASATAAYYHPPAPVVVSYPPPATTVHVTETYASPAPAPATGGQAAAIAKLKELKSLQSQGLITEAQYQAESQKLLNQIVQ
jgi:glycerate-2-kinase